MNAFLADLSQFSAALDRSATLAEVVGTLHVHQRFVLAPESERDVLALLERPELDDAAKSQLLLMGRLLNESREQGLERAATLLTLRVLLVRLAQARDTAARVQLMKERADVVQAANDDVLRAATHPKGSPPPSGEAFAALRFLFAGCRQGEEETTVREFEKLAAQLDAQAAPAGPPTGAGAGAGRLAGHWRHTEALSSREVSVVTDHHLVMAPDGRYQAWSHTVSAAASYEEKSPVEEGAWRLEGDLLTLTAGGASERTHVAVDGENLLMKDWNSRRIWERVR